MLFRGKMIDVKVYKLYFIRKTFFGEIIMQQKPLAFRMRPRTIEEVVGQQHLVGDG